MFDTIKLYVFILIMILNVSKLMLFKNFDPKLDVIEDLNNKGFFC